MAFIFSVFEVLLYFFLGPAITSARLEGPGIASSLPDAPTGMVLLALLPEGPG